MSREEERFWERQVIVKPVNPVNTRDFNVLAERIKPNRILKLEGVESKIEIAAVTILLQISPSMGFWVRERVYSNYFILFSLCQSFPSHLVIFGMALSFPSFLFYKHRDNFYRRGLR
jgi:NADH:ubiquinone oxidoreductase subunit 4 (subunit M)